MDEKMEEDLEADPACGPEKQFQEPRNGRD